MQCTIFEIAVLFSFVNPICTVTLSWWLTQMLFVLQVFCFGALLTFLADFKAGVDDARLQARYQLTLTEVQALKQPGVSVQEIRRVLMIEHNDIPQGHSAMTLDERIDVARESLLAAWAKKAATNPAMPPFPTEVKRLDEEQRRTAQEVLGLESAGFHDRMKLVLLPQKEYTRMTAILTKIREQARAKGREPQLCLKQLEKMVKMVSTEVLGKFLQEVQTGTKKLKDAATYAASYQMSDRTSIVFVRARLHVFVVFFFELGLQAWLFSIGVCRLNVSVCTCLRLFSIYRCM